jgi:cytochrome c2
MHRQRLRVAALVVAVAALVGGVASGLAASQTHHARVTAQKAYHVSASLKGTGASGLFSGNLNTTGTKGTLSWKFTLKPSGAASSAQIRAGATAAGALLVKLCAPCAASAHGSKSVAGSALAKLVAGKAGLVVKTSRSTLRGAVKVAAKSSGLTIVPTPALVAQGKAIADKQSCTGCHTLDGTKSTGPTWKGLAGSKVHQTDGTTITATDSYLVNVIEDPTTLKVVGYDPSLMASYIPPGSISHSQAIALVAYIKTIK